jgi:hypothetical protein
VNDLCGYKDFKMKAIINNLVCPFIEELYWNEGWSTEPCMNPVSKKQFTMFFLYYDWRVIAVIRMLQSNF